MSTLEEQVVEAWKAEQRGGVICAVCQGPQPNEPKYPCMMYNSMIAFEGQWYEISRQSFEDDKMLATLYGPVDKDWHPVQSDEPPSLQERLSKFKEAKGTL